MMDEGQTMDRDKVIKGLEGVYRCVSPVTYTCGECPYQDNRVECKRRVLRDAIALLKELEPVKHGRWEVWSRPGDEETGNCSVCKTPYSIEELFMGGTEFPKYCPECGARMDV